MQCKYERLNGRCHRTALESSEKGFCLLHEDWSRKNEEETKREFYREIEEGERDFEGCVLAEINLSGREFEGSLNFRDATIKGNASFGGATIDGDVSFAGATIAGDARFNEVDIAGGVSFVDVIIERDAWFRGAIIGAFRGDANFTGVIIKGAYTSFCEATIRGTAWFSGATIKGLAWFAGATIEKDAWFDSAKIGVAWFDSAKIEGNMQFNGATIEICARFDDATIKGDTFFNGATIKGDASFERATIEGNIYFPFANIASLTLGKTRDRKSFAKFKNVQTQENACREARKIQENRGNRALADDYFYREMEA
ncbi:MAG: pentapeptide repeat-containing protein, partial [Methanophagales archaeon]|nr:pentapeptide repeat-containing protein [Methanophagales archaeon]